MLQVFCRYSAAVANSCRLGGLNNRNLFLTVLETGRSMVRVPAQLGSGEDPLPGLQMAAFSLCPHMEERVERKQALPSVRVLIHS